jgi:D-glycero-D-manno-heptose 1,7-bisphosphate phosphatase
MRRLLILDMDRTVRVAACDLECLYEWVKRGQCTDDMAWGDPSQQVVIPEAAARIRAAAGDSIVCLASNQPDIAWGYKSEAQLEADIAWVFQQFPTLCGIAAAPYPDDSRQCWWWEPGGARHVVQTARPAYKPGPGMLDLIMTRWAGLSALFVGDMLGDREAAKAAGIPFQWAWDWWREEDASGS